MYVDKSVQNLYICCKIMKIFLNIAILSLAVLGAAGHTMGVAQSLPKSCAEHSCTIVFSGDFMQHTPQITAATLPDGGFDYVTPLNSIARVWRAADFAVVNLETTLAAKPPYTGYPMFRSPAAIAHALKQSGVTHVALANNHAMDAGSKGVESTLSALESAGVEYVGVRRATDADSIKYLSKGALKIALLNYTYGTNGMPVPFGVALGLIDTTTIAKHVCAARADSATHVVVFFHWGNEYERRANEDQRSLAAWCRASGVDLVIGSHPHVVQQIDREAGVVYSLGNFVSNQRERYKNSGISVRVTFLKGLDGARIEFLPHYVDEGYNIILPWQDPGNPLFDDSRQSVLQ